MTSQTDNAILHFRTRSDVCWVNDMSQIYTTQAPNPDNSWQLLGAVELGRGFHSGRVIRQYTVWEIRRNLVPWFYKNGKQRCFVLDYDHGSKRVWMSPTLQAVYLKGVGYVKGSYGSV